MSHRIIIARKVAEIFAAPEVRAEMTAQQCACVDAITQKEEPSDQDFRELTHRLNRVYSKDD